MRKLILIDPWLSDVGGHNFQYALDVCSSAVGRGYEPVLAVHKDLADPSGYPESWSVLRVFQFGVCSKHWLGPDGQTRHACGLDGRRLAGLRGTDRSPWSHLLRLLGKCRDVVARRDRARRIDDFASGCRQVMDLLNNI